ncbi:MAG TPA: SBBP repeat-containing protein [Bryobacteraceae bacterium]|jgi:uncharacterized protein (TIGR03437 family)|nr:SBBP repeat-containing protein [Bryobacteraceae bacterium]
MARTLRQLFLFLLTANVFAQSTTPLPDNTVANAVQVDAAGDLYLAGFSIASTQNPNALAHAFVAKLSPDASQTIWWTALAGSNDDRAFGLALGSDNSVYVTGKTQSADFPTTRGAFATAGNTFVTKLGPSGAVVYSTYVATTSGQAITVDSAGDAFITGPLSASDAFQATPGTVSGVGNAIQARSGTAYIVELNPAGTAALVAIAGFGGNRISLDAAGNIYAAGAFENPQAPTTPGAFQGKAVSAECLSGLFFNSPCAYQHVAKMDPTGTRLIFATYLSGTYGATPSGLALDSAGNVIVAGTTNSPDYPTTPAAFQPEYFANPSPQVAPPASVVAPPSQGYVTKLNATGTALVWSTFFGGSGGGVREFVEGDSIAGASIDASGNVWIAGSAYSADLPGLWTTPLASRPVAVNGQAPAGFVTRLSADGSMISATGVLTGLRRDLAEPTGGAVAALAGGGAVVDGSQVVIVGPPASDRVTNISDPSDNAKLVSVAPGQLVTLYGSNLAPEGTAAPATGFPTSFNGVSITFNGIPAPILYTAANQINLQAPYEIAGQSQVTMEVSSQSVSPAISESYIFAVVDRQPSIFVGAGSYGAPLFDFAACNGTSVAGVQPLAFNADGTMNSCGNPAAPGSPVTIFLNGAGVTSPAQVTGATSPAAIAVSPVGAVASPGAIGTFAPQTVPGEIASVLQLQLQAGTSTTAVKLELRDANGVFLLRGPGVVIWVAQ